MFKSIIKEIGISLLLFLAIIFIMSIVLYDYNPINKVIPNVVTYTVPESIKNEIADELTQIEETKETYTIDGSDLEQYKRDKSYVAGKANPFLVEEDDTDEESDKNTKDKTNEVTNEITNENTIKDTKDKTNTINNETQEPLFENTGKK